MANLYRTIGRKPVADRLCDASPKMFYVKHFDCRADTNYHGRMRASAPTAMSMKIFVGVVALNDPLVEGW